MKRTKPNNIIRKSLALFVVSAMCVTTLCGVTFFDLQTWAEPAFAGETEAATDAIYGQNSLIFTGDGIIENGEYTADNIELEKAFSLQEIKSIDGGREYLYSAYNNERYRSIQRARGTDINDVLQKYQALTEGKVQFDVAEEPIVVKAKDGKEVTMNPAVTAGRSPEENQEKSEPKGIAGLNCDRYYIKSGVIEGDTSEDVKVPTIIAWAESKKQDNKSEDVTASDYDDGKVRLIFGQVDKDDNNQPNWNGETSTLRIIKGKSLPANIAVGTSVYKYNRAEIMSNGYIIRSFVNSEGKEEYVKGAELKSMVSFCGNDAVMEISDVDGKFIKYVSMQEIIDRNYVLAYEAGDSAATLRPILDMNSSGDKTGCYRLYSEGSNPITCIGKIVKSSVSMDNCKVSLKGTSFSYAGKPIRPAVSISYNGRALEHEVTYRNNNAIGTASVIVTATGVTGSRTLYFKINPALVKKLSKVTSGKRSFTAKWAVLSSAQKKVQSKRISGYQVRYSTKQNFANAKYKTKSGYAVTSITVKNLKKGTKYYVQYRAYKTVNGKKYYSNWSARKYVKTK